MVVKFKIRTDAAKRKDRQRMKEIWDRIGFFEASEQGLADQAKMIIFNWWFTKVEIEEIRCRCKRSDDQGETNEEELAVKEISVENESCINDEESFQRGANKQGFDDKEKELLKEVVHYMKKVRDNISPKTDWLTEKFTDDLHNTSSIFTTQDQQQVQIAWGN